MSRFLITGFPRSRTAWFAVACSSSGRMCYHEPTAWLGDDVALSQLWAKGVGVSDAGLALRLPWVIDRFGPKTLIVERPRGEVIASAFAYFGTSLALDRKALDQLLDGMEEALAFDHPLIKRVGFHDLNDFSTLCACFDWLGVVPNGLRQLMHMRVQSDLDFNLDLLRKAA